MPYYSKQFHFVVKPEKDYLLKYSCDAIFLGHAENDMRLECFDYLLANEINLRIGGGNFIQWSEGRLFKQLLPEKYYDINEYHLAIQFATCSLCFFSTINRDVITYRVFEIPACKGVLLWQRSQLVESIFEEGIEALYFSTKEELLEKILWLKNNSEKRNEIAEAGYNKLRGTKNEVQDRVKNDY